MFESSLKLRGKGSVVTRQNDGNFGGVHKILHSSPKTFVKSLKHQVNLQQFYANVKNIHYRTAHLIGIIFYSIISNGLIN